jgi:hypothetical protein
VQQAIVVEGHFATNACLLDCLPFTEVLINWDLIALINWCRCIEWFM